MLRSAILGETRTLNIFLPPGFNKQQQYGVIYLLDGSLNEDFIHISGVVQFFHMIYNMPDFIVVGISNVDRKRDFTYPTNLKDLKEKYPTTGGSEKFINFIENELQPYINANFKINENRYLIGQSLGGLLATEILLKRPWLFTSYFIISPSLWWDNESLLKESKNLLEQHNDSPVYIFISVGAEGILMESVAEKLATNIRRAKKKKYTIDFVTMPKENHATILHNSIYEAFKIKFPYKE